MQEFPLPQITLGCDTPPVRLIADLVVPGDRAGALALLEGLAPPLVHAELERARTARLDAMFAGC